VNVDRADFDSGVTLLSATLEDLTTTTNGPIKLVAEDGTITVNEGGDDLTSDALMAATMVTIVDGAADKYSVGQMIVITDGTNSQSLTITSIVDGGARPDEIHFTGDALTSDYITAATARVEAGDGGVSADGSGDVVLDARGVTSDVAINAGVTTGGGMVDIDAGRDVTSTDTDDITTTAAAESGVASGAVSILAGRNIALAGDVVTTGAARSAAASGAASAGGQVDLTTTDGTIAVSDITTSGGAHTGGAAGDDGGAAAAVNLTSGDAVAGDNHDITINGVLTARGGSGDTDGMDATVTLTADGGVVDGSADTTTDVDARMLAIDAATGVGSTNALDTDVDILNVDNTTSGNIQIAEANSVTVIHADNDANAIGSGDLDNGRVVISSVGNLTIRDGDASVDAIQSESIIRLSGANVMIDDDIRAVEDGSSSDMSAADGTSITESIVIAASGNFELTAGHTISTDDDETPGESEDLTYTTDSGKTTTTDPDFIRIDATGSVTLGDDVYIRTDHGVARQIAPRPQLFADVSPDPTTDVTAFLQADTSDRMRSALDNEFRGEMVLTVGVAGEENLRIDIDWGEENADFFVRVAAKDVTDGVYSDDTASVYIVDHVVELSDGSRSTVTIPHKYDLDDYLESIRNGREDNLGIVGVRFSVTQNESIVITGEADSADNGEVPAFNVDSTDDGVFSRPSGGVVSDEPFVVPEGRALLSSTDTDGLLSNTQRAANGGFTTDSSNPELNAAGNPFGNATNPSTGQAEWEFTTAPPPPPELLAPPAPVVVLVPEPDIPPEPALIVTTPVVLDSGNAPGSTAVSSSDFFQLRRRLADGQYQTIIDRITTLQGDQLLDRAAFEKFVQNEALQDNPDYELWIITQIPGKGITIERPVVEFDIVNGLPTLAKEVLDGDLTNGAFKPLQLEPIDVGDEAEGVDGTEQSRQDDEAAEQPEKEVSAVDDSSLNEAAARIASTTGNAAVVADDAVEAAPAAVLPKAAGETNSGEPAASSNLQTVTPEPQTSDGETELLEDDGSNAASVGAVGLTFGYLARRRRMKNRETDDRSNVSSRLFRRLRRHED
jgi:hypothetical protein